MSYDCYCDDGPTAEFYHIGTHKARKAHKCEECNAHIRPGESYERVRAKWEGSISTIKTCARCVELREWAKISVPCFCWCHGSLHDDVKNMVDDMAHLVPGFFFEYGRRIIKIRRRADESRT